MVWVKIPRVRFALYFVFFFCLGRGILNTIDSILFASILVFAIYFRQRKKARREEEAT